MSKIPEFPTLFSYAALGLLGLVVISLTMTVPALKEADIFILPAMLLVGWLIRPYLVRYFAPFFPKTGHRRR